jgi:hypothetical protein
MTIKDRKEFLTAKKLELAEGLRRKHRRMLLRAQALMRIGRSKVKPPIDPEKI